MSSSTDNAANSIHSGESDNAVNNLENKFDTTGVVTMASAHAVHDTYTGFLPALYPELISKLTITRAEAGLFTFFMQVPSIVQPIIGYLADRASLKYLVILSPAIIGGVPIKPPTFFKSPVILCFHRSLPDSTSVQISSSPMVL